VRRRAGVFLLALLLAPAVVAASPAGDPFEAFGLVRLDGKVRVPDFTLPGTDRRTVSPAALRGSGLILVFWTTW
jgi:hypothetical protein